ncbi:MAG: hypothetical protein ABSA11_05575 [Candidatus Bathyarchaeia archaeon]
MYPKNDSFSLFAHVPSLLRRVKDSKTVGKDLARLLRVEELQNIYTNAKSCENMLEGKVTAWLSEKANVETQIRDRKLEKVAIYIGLQKKLNASKGRLTKRGDELERQRKARKSKRKEIEKKASALLSDS